MSNTDHPSSDPGSYAALALQATGEDPPPAARGLEGPAIRCRDLRKTYDRKVEALRGLDLEVLRGECFGLLGPNGAGKTTTIEILEGILEATSGEVIVLGEHWGRRDHDLRQQIGISLQETELSGKLSVCETVRLFRSFYDHGLDPEEIIARVSLTEKADAWVSKLSGGQRQRLAFACALVGDPALLFLDEPTTGLDPSSRREVWRLVRDFQKRGHTVLITTHYMDEAERLCNRVAIIDRGEVIALGSPAELISGLGAEHVIEFAVAVPGKDCAVNSGDEEAATRLTPQLADIESVTATRGEGSGLCMTVGQPHVAIPALLRLIAREELEIVRLTTRHASLEDVFVNLTGRHLDDDTTDSLSGSP